MKHYLVTYTVKVSNATVRWERYTTANSKASAIDRTLGSLLVCAGDRLIGVDVQRRRP